MKLRCLIIDDKPLAVDLLIDYTKKVPFLELVAATNNPIEGLNMLHELNIDLVFLDIQMPELTGLQFMTAAGPDYKVILTTAYADYAIYGYEHDVIDYLLKPISFERFYRAATKALNSSTTSTAEKSQISAMDTDDIYPEYLFIKTDSKLQKVNLADIIYVHSLQNYIVIHTIHEKIMSLQPLKRFEEQLPKNNFVRVHKSYIISVNHISHINGNRIYMIKKELQIPIGDTFKETFNRIIGQ